jgi:hypothetical protein
LLAVAAVALETVAAVAVLAVIDRALQVKTLAVEPQLNLLWMRRFLSRLLLALVVLVVLLVLLV